MITFRVHLSDGIKIDVQAETPHQAGQIAVKRYPGCIIAKIKKFAILPADFTVENGLLTPTLKVKRKLITDKHRETLDSLYR